MSEQKALQQRYQSTIKSQGSSGSLPPSNQLPARLHRGYLYRRPIRKVAALREQLARVVFQKAPRPACQFWEPIGLGCLDGASTREGGSRQRFAEGSLVLVVRQCRVAGSGRWRDVPMYLCGACQWWLSIRIFFPNFFSLSTNWQPTQIPSGVGVSSCICLRWHCRAKRSLFLIESAD